MGVRKEQFKANLLRAINTDHIGLADVTGWLEEVEGWGEQSVYLYNVPKTIATDPVWNSAEVAGCPAYLLNIAKRSLPKIILRGVGLASNDAVG
jgi:hypothetical protein